MLEQRYRESYQRFFINPFIQGIAKRATPLQITITGGLLGVTSAVLLSLQHAVLAIIFLLLSGYCDTLDGSLARYRNGVSELGTVLDILIDRIVEFAIVLSLWLVHPTGRSLLCLFMLGSILLCVTSFLVVGIFQQTKSEKSFYYSPGLIERPEAFIFFILMMASPAYFNFIAIVFIILVLYTTVTRVFEFAQQSAIADLPPTSQTTQNK